MEYVARKRLRLGPDRYREIGEAVPEAATWPGHILRAHIMIGDIQEVSKTQAVTVSTTIAKPRKNTKPVSESDTPRCAICGRSFKSARSLSLHTKKVHSQ